MFTKKAFCLVTGASKGLGKSIAVQFAAQWHENKAELEMMLLSRDEAGLRSCKEAIAAVASSVNVVVVPYDLSDVSHLGDVVSKVPAKQYDSLLLVHNAGTCPGMATPLALHCDGADMQKHFAINYTSMVVLNSLLLCKLSGAQNKTVVLITSIIASNPTSGLAHYGALKAARDCYASVLALENPAVRVLVYSPGPLDTDMLQNIRDRNHDEEVRKSVESYYKKGEVLQPGTSVTKLTELLKEDAFESGKVVDYFDGVLKGVVRD